tara:strand:+ start:2322 stop:2945 length:624 start_codon:yes stop_codon:yes gene_type:complete
MDNSNREPMVAQVSSTDIFSGKNLIISFLVFLLILSFLGINLLNMIGNLMENIVNVFGPLVKQVLSVFGYTAGTIIDKTADVATDVATTGVELAGGSVQSLGHILKDASKDGISPEAKQSLSKPLDLTNNDINQSKVIDNEPSPDSSSNPSQKPITSNKKGWCLVGEYEGKRGCIEVNNATKCLSGQVFPEEKLCLNPTFTRYTLTH